MLKFSITSLLLLLAIIAVGICAFKVHEQSGELSKTKLRLEIASEQAEIHWHAMNLLRRLNGNMPESKEIDERIEWMIGQLPSIPLDDSIDPALVDTLLFLSTKAEMHEIPSGNEQYTVLSLYYNSMCMPGDICTALALFNDGKLLDYTVHEGSTRAENCHHIRLSDANSDGVLDVEIEIEPGIWRINQPPTVVAYDVSQGKLTQMEHFDRGITKR